VGYGTHAITHQDGGSDEISCEGLEGILHLEQKSSWVKVSGKPTTFTPSAHKASHQDGGGDELSVAGLSGVLADEQPSSWALVTGKPGTFTPSAHKASHQNDGGDEISVAGLSGVLAEAQTPKTHAASHAYGGADALSQLDNAEKLSDLLPRDGSRTIEGALVSDIDTTLTRSVDSGRLIFAGGTGTTHGAYIQFAGGDYAAFPGSIRFFIGDRRAGYTLNSSLSLRYQANGSFTKVFEIDKEGNIVEVGTVDGVTVSAHHARHENGGGDSISLNQLAVTGTVNIGAHKVLHGGNAGASLLHWSTTVSTSWQTANLSAIVGGRVALVLIEIRNGTGSNHLYCLAPAANNAYYYSDTTWERGTAVAQVDNGMRNFVIAITASNGYLYLRSSTNHANATDFYLVGFI
jgi:hypothetical protein